MKYTAFFKKTGLNYTIEFPDFGVCGEGYSSLEETKKFARDYLAEIILAYRSDGKPLPAHIDKKPDEGGQDVSVEVIDIDVEKYNEIGQRIASRTYIKQAVSQEGVSTLKPFLNEKEKGKISTHITELKNKARDHIEDYVNRIPHKKAMAAAILAIIICATGVSVSNSIKDYRQSKYIEQTMQSSRENIKNGNYDDACDELTKLFGAKGTDSHKKEIDSLYNYSYMKNERQKSSPVGITKQYDCSKKIAFDSDDEFYKDAEKLKTEIKEEYDADQKEKQAARQKADEEKREREKQAAIEAEKQEAKKKREYLEKLATTIPFGGMEEEYIDCTACGAHTTETIGQKLYDLSTGDYKPHNIYEWHIDDELVLTVFCEDGKVDHYNNPVYSDGSISDYWTDDEEPLFESKSKTKKYYAPDSDHNYDLDDYLTGKEYADAKYKDKLENLRNDGYGDLNESDLENIAWIQSYNEWLSLLKPETLEPIESYN